MPADRLPITPAETALRPRTLGVLLPLAAVCGGLLARSIPHSSHYLSDYCLPGGAVGVLLGLVYWWRHRALGFVPFFLTGAAVAGIWGAFAGWCGVTAAAASGMVTFTLIRLVFALGRFNPATRFWWFRLLAVTASVAVIVLVGGLRQHAKSEPDDLLPAGWFAGVTAVAAAFAWVRVFRPAAELASVPVWALMYRVRAAGPGLTRMPLRGPCIVIANHACWVDPFFLALVLPRIVTPMMTSAFYDLPVVSWIMRKFGVIRVPEQGIKQGGPDPLQEAVAALDRGECVLIFPEGRLRRDADKPLKRFGRGIWQILAARPDTPVFACWIEGGWGSYCSFFNGPPTKNKRFDVRRPIGIGVAAPVVLDAAALGHHLRTRLALMNHVAAARTLLGLPEIPTYELPAAGAKDE